jgi:hypothetical protein
VEQERAPRPPRRARSRPEPQPRARQQRKPRPAAKAASPLPPGHVRKKDTGEIGRLRSVDPRAGTATVHWLKRGNVSVVPLSSVARR